VEAIVLLLGRIPSSEALRRSSLRRLVITCLTASLALTGCGSVGASDPLQVTNHLEAATPANSPTAGRAPAGSVLSAPAAAQATFDPATRTLAVTSGNTLALFDANAPQQPPRTVALAGTPAGLHAEPDGTLLVALPANNLVAQVDPRTGAVEQIPVAGGPVDATDVGGELAVALQTSRSVAFLDHGKVTRTASGFQDPAQLLTTGGGLTVLDRLATSITQVDPRTATKGASLRVGNGATNVVTDRYARILAIDSRSGALLAFSTNPLLEKQMYPVAGVPYGIAYDPTHDLAWVTLTGTNEVVGYDVTGGEPVERYRFPTVRQPNSVAVDPATGAVFVASASGAGIQVVKV
jgi:DNA-binding beta-propeller fold protein YncE